jgi:WD40 repeat protein
MTAMAGRAGQLLCGRYRLIEPVGKGAMGQVWRGHDEILARSVAVKEILLPAGLQGKERDNLIARTLREARAVARLRHPGIVTVYDAVQFDDVPWTVLEYVSGPSLEKVIAHGRLPWEQVAALGADLADALGHAHAAGVVHRDLKPGNVLLAERRTVLTDFGVARLLDATTELTAEGALIGTPQYMAPEQIDGASVGAPADLWALGVTLYTAVEGCPPFDGPTLTALLTAIVTRSPPIPQFAGPLAPVISALLSKAPSQRPDAGTLARQLGALLRSGSPVVTVSSSAAAPPTEPATVLSAARLEPTARPAVLDGQGGRVYSVAFGPGGTMLASGCDQGVRPDGSLVKGGRRVRLWDVGSHTCTAALTGPEGAAFSVAFSPDGALLASGNAGQPVYVWRMGDRFRRGPVTLADDTDVMSVAFSPDGALLATGSGDHTIRLWDVPARTCVATLTGHGEMVRQVAFSPDGTTLASGSVDQTIRLWDVAARTCAAVLTDGLSAVFSVAFSPDGSMLASGGADTTVQLWDTATRTRIAILAGHAKAVTSVAFSPDGSTLASGSHDRTVRLWRLR